MPEEQNKKINYKILTAEELLKEETPPSKEIKHEEERIEVPVTEKIEAKEQVVLHQEIKEKKEVIEPQIETGLIHPEKEKPGEIPIPEIKEVREVVSPKVEPAPIPEKPVEVKPIEKAEIKEPLTEEIFYKPTAKKPEPPKPRLDILKEELKEKISKPAPKLPNNFIKYVSVGGGLILVIGLIIFFKPYERLKSIFVVKEKPKSEEEIKITTPTPTTIIFPTTSAKTLPATPTTITESISTETIITTETKPVAIPTETTVLKEIQFLENFSSREITIQGLDFQVFQKELNNFLAKQEAVGTKINLKFLYGQKIIPFNFIFDYFIKPTKISTSLIESFKNELTGNYGFLLYYGYTRKYPLLIFEIKDKEKVEKFNQQWEKISMKDDLKTLFLGNEPPRTKNNFITKRIYNFKYRILDFGNNYKITWTIIDNYLIYSTTENGLQEVINYLK